MDDEDITYLEGSRDHRTSGGSHANASEKTPLVGASEGGATIGWSQFSPKLKGAISLCAVLALIVLLVTFVLASISLARTSDDGRGERDSTCALSKSVPQLDPPRAAWPGNGTTSMVKLAGYIHVYELGFLSLDITRMTVTKSDTQTGQVSLADDCVKLTIDFRMDNNTTMLTGIRWSSAGGDLKHQATTTAVAGNILDKCASYVPSWSHYFPTTNRYSCGDREVVECLKYGDEGQLRPVAELVISSLEMELYGAAEQISRGKFSKPAYLRSCSQRVNSFAQV